MLLMWVMNEETAGGTDRSVQDMDDRSVIFPKSRTNAVQCTGNGCEIPDVFYQI